MADIEWCYFLMYLIASLAFPGNKPSFTSRYIVTVKSPEQSGFPSVSFDIY